MYSKTPIKCDLMVIGSGLSGMAATLFAIDNGFSVCQAGVSGEILYSTGFFDLLGVYPTEDKKIWDNPWEGMNKLIAENPQHPYAKVDQKEMETAISKIISFLNQSGIHYFHEANANQFVITPVGTLKPTYAIPKTMQAGIDGYKNQVPGLIVGFKGLKGFSSLQIKTNLVKKWPKLKAIQMTFPDLEDREDLYPEHMARFLESPSFQNKLITKLKAEINGIKVIGLPAVLGITKADEVHKRFEKDLGIPVFEIPTMPPGIPGLRIKEVFEKELVKKGVRALYQQRVRLVRHETDESFTLGIGETGTEQTVNAKYVVLATGRFLGQGLHASRLGIVEQLFDLPVYQPQSRGEWYNTQMFDPKGHQINKAGLDVDEDFRPLDEDAKPAFQHLYAVGSILGHQDWIRTKSGSGIAITTAYGAIQAIVRQS